MQKCVNILIPKLLSTILPLLCALQLEDSEGTRPLQRPSFMAARLQHSTINGTCANLDDVFIYEGRFLEIQAHTQWL